MVKFCKQCGSLLSAVTSSGELIFHCVCGQTYPSTAEDSLRSEEYLEAAESKLKFQTFIDNSPFDPAGKIVNIECRDCFAPFLTLIYIGANETPLYTCRCGQRYTVIDLHHTAAEKKEAQP